jgi:hypothetical protein
LFFASAAFIPLSCLGGCGLAMLIPNETAQAVLGMVGILAPFIGLGGLLLMWGDRGRYGRSLDFALQAQELGLSYLEQPTPQQLAVVKSFQTFQDPTSEYSRNCLTGPYESTSVLIMDYSCAWGRGRFAYVIAQTVIVLPDVLAKAPDLILCPKGLFGKLAEAAGLGGRSIPVAGQEQLNREYALHSEEPARAAALFTSKVAEVCLREGNLVLEVSRGSLLVFWSETYFKPGELEERLATALELGALLRRAG